MAGFTVPNLAAASFAAQAKMFRVDIEALAAGALKTGVLSGCAVTASGSGMTLNVAAGGIVYCGKEATVSSGTVTPSNGHASLDRFDLIVANSSGTKSVIAGTAAAVPDAPDLPSGYVPLALLWVPATTTTALTSHLIDKRVMVHPGERAHNVLDYGALADGTTNDRTALQDALDAASASTYRKTVFVPPGRYLVAVAGTSGPPAAATVGLSVPAGVTVIGYRNGSQLYIPNKNVTGLSVSDGTIVRGLHLIGSGAPSGVLDATNGGYQCGIDSGNSDDVLVEGCYFEDWALHGARAADNCNNWSFVNNRCTGSGDEGLVNVNNTGDVTYLGNYCWSNGKNGIGANGARGIFVGNHCWLNGGGTGATSDIHGILLWQAVAAASISYSVVANNVCHQNVGEGIRIGLSGAGATADGIVISGNCLYDNDSNGLLVEIDREALITGNTIYGNGSSGIALVGGDDHVVIGNTIADNGSGYGGILMTDTATNRVKIVDNVIVRNYRNLWILGTNVADTELRGNTLRDATNLNVVDGGARTVYRDNAGINPGGYLASQPSLPATTVAYTNVTGYDCTVVITGGTVTAITLAGQATGLTSGTVRVKMGQTLAVTYSSAPTWRWYGD